LNKNFFTSSNFKIKAISEQEDSLVIEGYANTTEKDRVGDVILQEAWTKGGLDNYMKNPIILAYHDHSQPIGEAIDYSIDAKGLRIVAEISKHAGNIYNLIKDGVLKTFSVGFRIKDADYDRKDDTFTIKDLELFEVSVVSVPANASSTFSIAKSLEDSTDLDAYKKMFEKEAQVEHTKDVLTKEDVAAMLAGVDNKKELSESIETLTASIDLASKYTKEEFKALLEESQKSTMEFIKELLENNKKEEIKEVPVENKNMSVEVGLSGVEKLVADLQAKMEAQEAKYSEVISSLKAEIAEKSSEIENVVRSKMKFQDKSMTKDVITDSEKSTAVLAAKILGRPIQDTKYFQGLLREKSGQGHFDGTVSTGEWETTYSTQIQEAVRSNLVVAPLFTKRMQMPTRYVQIPTNPEAGYGTWVDTGSMSNGTTQSAASSGTAQAHELGKITLEAFKLATKEYIGYEEEEDSIIPLIPIIQGAMARRMAKSIDRAMLTGDPTTPATGYTAAPFSGVANYAKDATLTVNASADDTLSYANFMSLRAAMGVQGLQPGSLVFIVNTPIYYSMLEDDTAFIAITKADVVGNAISSGVVGTYGGIKVVVSDEFTIDGTTGVPVATLVNPNGFLVGNYGSMRTERDRDIVNQSNVLVTATNIGFIRTQAGSAVALVNP
jgi:HK97 family phage prohead protease/HK97 family phage major capsid protein